jgi:hypothetical protein
VTRLWGQPLQLKRHLIETIGHEKGVVVQPDIHLIKPSGHEEEVVVQEAHHLGEVGVRLDIHLIQKIPNDDHIKLHRKEPLVKITHFGEEGARDTMHIRHSNVRVDINTSPFSKLC